jgi:eukaryotic-like serine/threonine-protein kinase
MAAFDFERVRAAFLAARDLDPRARDLALAEACGADAALRDEVESLLFHHDAARSKITTPAIELKLPVDGESALDEVLPRSFGDFELLEVIGRGGMGTVYRARQRTPEREVALKLIRRGRLTSAMLDRFRHEANLLARLNHPGIAQIYQAGVAMTSPPRHADVGSQAASTGAEQPYIAMELVRGHPIDMYARIHDLAAADRAAMVAAVCEAVHHAHQKGVIHLDLKPANILVDADGRPRVLDFGIALAIDQDGADAGAGALGTRVAGTPAYMSPEQLAGRADDLDARADIYALGVVLVELLTDRSPGEALRENVATSLRTASKLQTSRRDFRRDLELIAGRSLAEAPDRRYHSAAALADDLRRALACQPVMVRPPSALYHLRLFARRHRSLVASGAGAALLIVAASGVSVVAAVRAKRSAEREAAQRLIAERTSEHLERMLTAPSPHHHGAGLSVASMLDLMVEGLDRAEELPEVEARLRGAVGKTYLSMRRSREAAVQLERAAAIWRGIGGRNEELAGVLTPLGIAQLQVGDAASAERSHRTAIALLEDVESVQVDEARAGLADLLTKTGQLAEAEPLVRELLHGAGLRGDRVMQVAWLRSLARIKAAQGAPTEGEAALGEARTLIDRHIPPEHPVNAGVWLELAKIRLDGGDAQGALEPSRQAYALVGRAESPGSFDWMVCVNSHLMVLDALARRDEALEVLGAAEAAVAGALGEDHRIVREIRARAALTRAKSPSPSLGGPGRVNAPLTPPSMAPARFHPEPGADHP